MAASRSLSLSTSSSFLHCEGLADMHVVPLGTRLPSIHTARQLSLATLGPRELHQWFGSPSGNRLGKVVYGSRKWDQKS